MLIYSLERWRGILDNRRDIYCQIDIQCRLLDNICRNKNMLSEHKFAKNKLNHVISDKNCSEIKYFAVEFENTPTIAGCSYIGFGYDLFGSNIQEIMQHTVSCSIIYEKIRIGINTNIPSLFYLSMAVFASRDCNIAFFVWHEDASHVYEKFLHSLTNVHAKRLTDAIIYMATSKFENLLYINPKYWDELIPDKKEFLKKILHISSLGAVSK